MTLDGTLAIPVQGLRDGVRNISPMLNITRTWNAISACALMRRGLALARDYATKREVFGRPLIEQPLHVDTLAGLVAEFQGALHLTLRVVELLGRAEAGELDEAGEHLLRILTPIAKLTTARQAVAVASECLEAFGGAGYVEDTGLPMLLRDAQVLTIWEGTTNVLALDTLRAVGPVESGGIDALFTELERCAIPVQHPSLVGLMETAHEAADHAIAWLIEMEKRGATRVLKEAGARRFALTLGRALELALLTSHAEWSRGVEGDQRTAMAALRLATNGIDSVLDPGHELGSSYLASDRSFPTHPPEPVRRSTGDPATQNAATEVVRTRLRAVGMPPDE